MVSCDFLPEKLARHLSEHGPHGLPHVSKASQSNSRGWFRAFLIEFSEDREIYRIRITTEGYGGERVGFEW